MTTKEKIISTLRGTGRENIEIVIKYMEKHGFFTKECHHHHKYTGGLADHAWQTYQIALKMAEMGMTNVALDKDSLAICAMLHDFCDCDGMHIGGHGYRSAEMLKALGLNLNNDEYLAIRYHMSLYRHRFEPLYEAANRCQLRYVVHNADHKSAMICRGSEIRSIWGKALLSTITIHRLRLLR